MIRVAKVPKPAKFDKEAGQPGERWLEDNPTSTARPPALWNAFTADLSAGFGGLCGYAAMFDPTGGTVDHYLSYKHHRHLAYDWGNYRFASGTLNSSKKTADDTVLDPFEVQPGWFEILLPSLQMRVTDVVPDALRAALIAEHVEVALPESEVHFGLVEIAGVAGVAQRAGMVLRGGRHDLHQPARAGRADGRAAEHRFLQGVGIDERRIDLPAAYRGPLWRGEADRRFWLAAMGRVVGHPQLGGRQAHVAGEARQRLILRRLADAGLMAQHFVGQAILSDLAQLHGDAHIADIAQALPVGLGKVCGAMLLRQRRAKLFGGQHAIQRLVTRGGHNAAGTCQIANDRADEVLKTLVQRINADG